MRSSVGGGSTRSRPWRPSLARSDSLVTEPAFRSKQAALEGDAISAIYSAQLDLPKPGDYSVLVVTRFGDDLLGATSKLNVSRRDEIPAPGDTPPAIDTDTLEEVGGQVAEIETRDPPDDMHSTEFADVVGERPVALLFATPQLCASRWPTSTCRPSRGSSPSTGTGRSRRGSRDRSGSRGSRRHSARRCDVHGA